MTEALARELDARLHDDVMVVGSPPPAGRDLDVLARPDVCSLIAEQLTAAGFENDGGEWVRFAHCSVDALDLIPSTTFGLDERTTDELFADARRLEGFSRLVRPAPHHVLLMLARWTIEGDGTLSEKRRARIQRAVEEDPNAWETAAARAAAWRASAALAGLRRAAASGSSLGRAERAAGLAEAVYAAGRTPGRARLRAWLAVLGRRRRRACLISFSGLDGAGKSSQVEALRLTLERLGHDVNVQWIRLEWTTLWENRWLGVLGWPARASLGLVGRLRARKPRDVGSAAAPPSVPAPSEVRERSTLLSQVWVAVVAVAHGLAQRRETRRQLALADVVICDRYTLDAAAHLRFRYGEQRNFGAQIGLVDRLSPKPSVGYLLDVPAATAHARKAEQYSLNDLQRQADLYRQEAQRLGVRVLDGELPREELCARIAREVWRAVRS